MSSSADPPAPQILYSSPTHRVTKARYVTSSDPRGYVPVYEYPLNGQWIMMDIDDGYVLWTGIWKALGNSKADIVKIIESQPDLATKLRRVRGGYLKMQGTWMARDVALELARRVAWNIRYDLVPLFGPSFPNQCLSPDQPGYGKVVTRSPPKPRRSKKSATDASPPPSGSDALVYVHDHSPSVEPPTFSRAEDYFVSPVASNRSMAPERMFDTVEAEGGAVYEAQPNATLSGAHAHYGNQANWSLGSSGAVIKEESEPSTYSYPTAPPNPYGERYAYPSPQHTSPGSTHGDAGQMRRQSVSHAAGYPASPASSTYSTYQEAMIKQERGMSDDGSYVSYAPSSASSPYSPFTPPSMTTYPTASEYVVPTHQRERSRSDSQYVSYQHQTPTAAAPQIRYSSSQQGYASTPSTSQAMTFGHQGQTNVGYTSSSHSIDPYQQHQQVLSPQEHVPSQHPHQQHQYGYEYGYGGYGGDPTGQGMGSTAGHGQHQMSDARQTQYPGQYSRDTY